MVFYKAKFWDEDGKEKWLSWSHWGSSMEEGFYYVTNEMRAAVFSEESIVYEEVIAELNKNLVQCMKLMKKRQKNIEVDYIR